MKYELAKQLKDAGFPQDSDIFKFIKGDNGNIREVNTVAWDEAGAGEDLNVISPTLTELIEACGEDFSKLVKYGNGDGFFASASRLDDDLQAIAEEGKTAEEAVANLWLYLQEQSK